MTNSSEIQIPPESFWQRLRQKATFPPWLISTVIHIVLLLILGLAVRSVPQGAMPEPDRSTGIVLVKNINGKREFFDGSNENNSSGENNSNQNISSNLNQGEANVESKFDATSGLPNANLTGPGPMGNDSNGEPGSATKGGSPKRTKSGGAITNVFGVEGEGFKFVYVFDRSDSMAGAPLASAKSQLLASLKSLDCVHQFQIIFYSESEKPLVFAPTGQQGRLVFATDQNKRLAERFVNSVKAGGGTKPKPALIKAVEMQPQVIFFLTDGDGLNFGVLESISRLNKRRSASINVIQFGEGFEGGQGSKRALLRAFVKKNGGKHVYFDTEKIEP